MNNLNKRILYGVTALVSVMTMPWYFSLILLAVLVIYLSFYAEVLVFGFLFDRLYATDFQYTGLIVSAIFLLAVAFFKTRIRR